ncbi:hypothetical protein PIB30_071634 [Stylosanthes scabra]|uniref:Uncharacterized protein n=1 Tax=Stylosanthes scabra TaxID=79078 RepID=A0ABU6TQF0_9FABA|nr:hypothetical protein [Stylosanthes scabra]
MGFGAFSYLPIQNLDQVLLKQIFDCYDIYDNTIYTDAAAVKITTKKIGDALGLSSNGAAYDKRVVRKNLSEEDKDVHKFFQGKTSVALQNLIKMTPLENDENRKLFMRRFKGDRSTASMDRYWIGEVLEKRMKQEKKLDAGLLKTREMRARKKKTTMRFPSSDADSLSGSESYRSRSSYSASEFESTSDSEHTVSEEPPSRKELSIKRKSDRAVVGSNAPLNTTRHSVAVAGSSELEDIPLAVAFENLKKRRKQQREERNIKQRVSKINEGHEVTQEAGRSAFDTRMFDSFDTGAEVQAPPIGEDVVYVEIHPGRTNDAEPVLLNMQQTDTRLVSEVEAPPPKVGDVVQEGLQPEQQHREKAEEPNDLIALDPEPIDMQGPSETQDPEPCSLTLRPWLQPEAADEIITDVLLSMNKEGPSTRDEDQVQQTGDEDQPKTPEAAPINNGQ